LSEPPALREVAPGHRVACHWVASWARSMGLFISKQPTDCARQRQDLLSAPSCETRDKWSGTSLYSFAQWLRAFFLHARERSSRQDI